MPVKQGDSQLSGDARSFHSLQAMQAGFLIQDSSCSLGVD